MIFIIGLIGNYIKPMFTEDFLQVSNLHKIYYATAGNRSGIPLLKIHGGPGSCCKIDFFNEIDADIFCIQETKMQEGQADISKDGYYHYIYHQLFQSLQI